MSSKKRLQRIILFILLSAVVAGYFLWPRSWVTFSDYNRISSLTPGIIQVDGTRVPGGPGIWRYHIDTGHWEKIPSRVFTFPPDSTSDWDDLDYALNISYWHNEVTALRLPLDLHSFVFCQQHDDPPLEEGGFPYHETKRFMEMHLSDGKPVALGTFSHTPKLADWDVLPDRSGFWVKQERLIKDSKFVQPVIHFYSFRTHQWKTIVCKGIYCLPQDPFSRTAHCSMIPHHNGWVLVFNNGDYYNQQSKKGFEAELWVNLATGAVRLGEPSTNSFMTIFSPDGQYCFMERKIMRSPAWPQGAGIVGRTYSAMPKIGTLPELPWNHGPVWLADSRHLTHHGSDAYSLQERLRDEITLHLPLELPEQSNEYQHSIIDLAGKEVGMTKDLRDQWLQPVGQYLLGSSEGWHAYRFFLFSIDGKVKREVFRVANANNR